MTSIERLVGQPDELAKNGHSLIPVVSGSASLQVYPHSLRSSGPMLFFVARQGPQKSLFIYSPAGLTGAAANLVGEPFPTGPLQGSMRCCPLVHGNARIIQTIFSFTQPAVVGLRQSFGFGDRLGIANPGHVRSLTGSSFFPVLAQQSIRELTRTKREAEDVMDAAVWAVFQEGYTSGFGADADHLKTTADIDRMVKAGFTMFTFDPSEHVVNAADTMSVEGLAKRAASHPWADLNDNIAAMVARYEGKTVVISKAFTITPDRQEVLRAVVKYGGSLAHIRRLNDHLLQSYPGHPREVEVSVDETESVTSPFEHFFMASELQRLKVEIVSLAPRFVGEFEKGIDYKGTLDVFRTEYLRHVEISDFFGSHKISFHSGSDKFGVYETVGKTGRGKIHVKTAGTSYLEALKVAALQDAGLFREILDFSTGLFEQEKASYHVSARLSNVKKGASYSDSELPTLFGSDDIRQVLHVTFGKVLTSAGPDGKSLLFRDRLMACLDTHEDVHYDILVKHFKRHLDPLESLAKR